MSHHGSRVRAAGWLIAAAAAAASGCATTDGGGPRPLFGGDGSGMLGGRSARIHPAPKAPEVSPSSLPRELNKVAHPPYMVEAPDILLIDAQRLVPLPPYKVEPLDVLYLFAPGAPDRDPINGPYPVDPDGTINLGPNYGGQVRVADMTVAEIEKMMSGRFKQFLKEPNVTVSLAQSKGVQQIRGEHLVRPDGTLSLGGYGSVYVAGMTLPQIEAAVEAHLSQYLHRPDVSVDVYAYNSKFYYVVTDFAGSGEQVVRLPSTGNETVLDAISMIGGLSPVSSKRIWIARPAPDGCGDQILPVDWRGITRRGTTGTNYQVLPGDRVFVMSQPMTKFDTLLGRTLAPAERALGVTLLGASAVRTVNGNGFFGGGGGNGTVVNVAR